MRFLFLTLLFLALARFHPAAGRTAQTPERVLYRTTVSLSREGEAHLRLRAAAPGCDWGVKGRESAVVSLTVDGERNQEIVLFRGATTQDYDALLGPLSAGKHDIAVTFRPDLSPSGVSEPRIEKMTVLPKGKDERERLAWKHSPLLYGRADNASTDVPLVLYYDLRDEGANWHIIYSLIWSNEDGGTGNDLGSLVARWGRSTDIEWIYDVTIVKATGTVTKGLIQAAGHATVPFAGQYRGNHPLLRTSTTNNMVADSGTSPLLFSLAPLRRISSEKETREAIMDAFPWTHALAAKEMAREGKWETPADPATIAASDIRNYLQVDYQAQFSGGALLAVRVRLADGREFFSDHGRRTDAIGRSGWVRTTVELPSDTPPASIKEIAFLRRDTGTGSAALTAARAFFLDREYRPQKPLRVWTSGPNVSGVVSSESPLRISR
jgi:hypothetical protein